MRMSITPSGNGVSADAPVGRLHPLAALSLAMLLSSLGTSIANIGLPALAQSFSASFSAIQWVVLAYLLAVTIVIVSVGRLGDLLGHRRVLLVGILIFTAGSAACAAAPGFSSLVAARAVQGIGAATMMALSVALVGASVPKAKTGSAMGLLGTMSAVGTAIGPSLGGISLSMFGWRGLFIIQVPLGVLAFLLARHHLLRDQRGRDPIGARLDHLGTLLLTLTLSAYALGMTVERGRMGAISGLFLLAAAIGSGLFIAAETRASAPLLRPALLLQPGMGGGLAMSLLVASVMMATLVVGPFYLLRTLHLDATRIGAVMSAGPFIAALVGIPAGRLVDRVGAPVLTIGGLAAMAAGALSLALVHADLGILAYLAPTMLTTAGYAVFQAANNTAVMASIASDQRGVASGMLNLSRNLGLITGASLMAATFAIGSGVADVAQAGAEATAHGFRFSFSIGFIFILIALIIAARSHARARAATR